MADEIDLANDLIDNEINRRLVQLRQNASQNMMGSKLCQECGEGIPVERQKLGFKFCVPCAQESERRKSLYADYAD